MPGRSETGSRGLSPLGVVVLSLLLEAPMHAYRMQQLIKARHKDEVVNVAQRNSIYQAIDRLRRAELIAVRETERDAGRPERIVYEITEAGAVRARDWLRDTLAEPAREFPVFPVALAFLPLLGAGQARQALLARERALVALLDEVAANLAHPSAPPRLFLVEDEYRRAVLVAELAWLRGLLADLASGALTWDTEALLTGAAGAARAVGAGRAVGAARAVGAGGGAGETG